LPHWGRGTEMDEPMIYGKLAIDAHDAKIRAEALREAADRAGKEIEDQGMEEVVSIRRLRAAIYAGEVEE